MLGNDVICIKRSAELSAAAGVHKKVLCCGIAICQWRCRRRCAVVLETATMTYFGRKLTVHRLQTILPECNDRYVKRRCNGPFYECKPSGSTNYSWSWSNILGYCALGTLLWGLTGAF